MNHNGKTLYTGGTHTTSGGRDGAARGTDGRLDIKLSSPGSQGEGGNAGRLRDINSVGSGPSTAASNR